MTLTDTEIERRFLDAVAEATTSFSARKEATKLTVRNEIEDNCSAVYKLYTDDECRYIGETLSLRRRLFEHINKRNPDEFVYSTLNMGTFYAHARSIVRHDGIQKTIHRLTKDGDGGLQKAILRAEEQRLLEAYVSQHGTLPDWNTEYPSNYR